jgi:vanillin dehydrogenase
MSDPITTSQLLVDNAWVDAAAGRTFSRTDPYTGMEVSRGAAASVDDVNRVLEAAADGFATWRATPPDQRAAVLLETANILLARGDELAELAMMETGTPLSNGHLSVGIAVSNLRWAAGQVSALEGRTIPSTNPGRMSLTVREPAGAVLVIAPWNGAVFQLVRAAVMPLALGNSVVLRGSEMSPRCHAAVAEAFVAAGAPPGVVGFLTNDPADSPTIIGRLVASKTIRCVTFTGSDRVGSIVSAQAAQQFKPVVMELGDSSPVIVLSDADLDEAVQAVVIGGFTYSGQGCIATERLIVDQTVAEEFTSKLVAAVSTMKSGDPRDETTTIPPLINTDAVHRVDALVTEAVAAGASVLCGGKPDGPCYPATVVTDVTPQMRIFQDETFGPVVTITTVDGPEEALQLANDSRYGLSSAVFTRNVELGLSMARRIETGMCHVNGMTLDDEAPVPFGGVKRSGIGRHGLEGAIAAFTTVKWITVEAPAGSGRELFGISIP